MIAQFNLVPNGSFEDLRGCPSIPSQISLAAPWKSATIEGTPDIYNVCAASLFDAVGVPSNRRKCYQLPKSGNGYSGIGSYSSGIIYSPEYMTTKLLKPLVVNKTYYIEFYISPSVPEDPVEVPCFIEGLGLVISKIDSIYDIKNGDAIPLRPIIKNNGIILKDTQNWIRISGCTLGNLEQYLIIGNFNSNKNTLVDSICHTIYPNSSYYYIDDVGIYNFDPLPDTLYLCNGETMRIGGGFLDGKFHWNTGEQDSIIEVSKTGLYILNVQVGNCILSDSVLLLDPEKIIENEINEVTICKDEVIALRIPINGTYYWSGGQDSKEISVSEPGQYSFKVINDCGIFSSTFIVNNQECDCKFYAPNIFSPNSDHINDNFQLTSNCALEMNILSFEIFDRWGQIVYKNHYSKFDNLTWDGTVEGKKLNPGVFIWMIRYEYIHSGIKTEKSQIGDVSIIY